MVTAYSPGDKAEVRSTGREVTIIAQYGDSILVSSAYGQMNYRPEQLRPAGSVCNITND